MEKVRLGILITLCYSLIACNGGGTAASNSTHATQLSDYISQLEFIPAPAANQTHLQLAKQQAGSDNQQIAFTVPSKLPIIKGISAVWFSEKSCSPNEIVSKAVLANNPSQPVKLA